MTRDRAVVWLGRTLRREPLCRVAGPLYGALSAAELRLVRAMDATRARALATQDLRVITAVIKTFERPRALLRLLASLRTWFPDVRVIVADDSADPARLRGVEVIRLPFDSGVSLGRQAALDRVESEYTWLLDDDFVIYGGTRLDVALAALERYPELDLVGGAVINLPLLRKSRSDPRGIYPTRAAPRLPLGPHESGLEICDKVPNFYLARTARLRLVGFTPELKRLDHADFFTRARGVLVTAYADEFRCLHVKTPFDRRYLRHRLDCDADWRVIERRYYSSAGPGDSAGPPATPPASRAVSGRRRGG